MSAFRIYLIFGVFLVFAAALGGRLFALQIYDHGFFAAFARGQQQVFEDIAPDRGKIFAKGLDGITMTLAANRDWPKLYAIPQDIEDPVAVSRVLASILTISEEELAARLSKSDDPYEPLASKLTEEQARAIRDLSLKGIVLSSERLRSYPQGNLAAHVLGFLAYDDQGTARRGVYGIEAAYDELLEGIGGGVEGERDAQGRVLAAFSRIIRPATPGGDVVLTIDPNIQYQAEAVLKEAAEKWDAVGGSIIVMEPSGAVRAMANYPMFDPNFFGEVTDPLIFNNDAVSSLFEPGSVFKPITMASGIEAGVVNPQTTYENTGSIQIGSYTISNTLQQYNGTRTMTEVLTYSLNTGSVFVETQLGKERFVSFLEKLGLSQKTGIELPAEQGGNIKNLESGRDINFATASFGQGIAMTPLALVRIIGALANGGILPAPYVIEEVHNNDGTVTIPKRNEGIQVFSPRTARLVGAMLSRVVSEGTGKTARIDGWTIAGKTGTAQVPNKNAPGYSQETIHSFIGYFPAFAPRYIILVKLDSPKVRYAESSSAPAFKKLAEFLLSYAAIPPDQN